MLSISELPGSISRLFIHPECAWPGWAPDGVAARGFVSGRGPQAQRSGRDSPAGAYRPKPTRPGTWHAAAVSGRLVRGGGIRAPEHAAATENAGGNTRKTAAGDVPVAVLVLP